MAGRAAVRQRGWAGALLLLIALLITMALAGVALKQYGLAPGATPRTAAGKAPAAAPEGEAPGSPTALERARGLQDAVRQQATEVQQRIDSADHQ